MSYCWFDFGNHTCMLADKHDGPHEPTSDNDILISLDPADPLKLKVKVTEGRMSDIVSKDGTPNWAYDEDGYCVCCGNGHWKHHMPECELRDSLDALNAVANPDYATLFAVWWKNDFLLNDQERLTLAFDAALGVTEEDE